MFNFDKVIQYKAISGSNSSSSEDSTSPFSAGRETRSNFPGTTYSTRSVHTYYTY